MKVFLLIFLHNKKRKVKFKIKNSTIFLVSDNRLYNTSFGIPLIESRYVIKKISGHINIRLNFILKIYTVNELLHMEQQTANDQLYVQ